MAGRETGEIRPVVGAGALAWRNRGWQIGEQLPFLLVRFLMSLAPLFAAPAAIQIHALAAIAAFFLGLWLLFGRKGTPSHRLLGRIWVGLMLVTAISTLWMRSIFAVNLHGYGPIHILSVVTIVSSLSGVAAARAGKISVHRKAMISLFACALVGAGVFTLVPGRIMGAVVFGW